MNKNKEVAKGARLFPFILIMILTVSGFVILPFAGGSPEEPPRVTTDKYTYFFGEPVHITVTGHIKVSSGTWLERGFTVMDENGNWARDPPQIGTEDFYEFDGPVYFTWDQRYDVLFEYDMDGSNQVHYPNNGEAVSPGKYYLHSFAPGLVEIEIVGPLESSIDIDPDTLNLKGKGKWITAYITLPKGYDVNDIDIDSVLLEDRIQAAWGSIQDDVLMVKFDRSEVEEMVSPGQVALTVSGQLKNGIPFSGSDTIIVISPPETKNK